MTAPRQGERLTLRERIVDVLTGDLNWIREALERAETEEDPKEIIEDLADAELWAETLTSDLRDLVKRARRKARREQGRHGDPVGDHADLPGGVT